MGDTATDAVTPHETASATIDFTVEGTTCGSCAARIQRLLSKQPGVADAEVNFATVTAHVALEGEGTEVLTAAVERMGYGLKQLAATTPLAADDVDEEVERRRWLRRVWLAWPLASACPCSPRCCRWDSVTSPGQVGRRSPSPSLSSSLTRHR